MKRPDPCSAPPETPNRRHKSPPSCPTSRRTMFEETGVCPLQAREIDKGTVDLVPADQVLKEAGEGLQRWD